MKRLKFLVRKNLKMSANKVGGQCAHAAIGLYKKDPQEHHKCIVLDASDKKFEEAKAARKPSEYYIVVDAGYTEVPAGSETVIVWWEEDIPSFEESANQPDQPSLGHPDF
jgi:peptidyl-tRNA hydrolase, PTH2 family